MTEAAPDGSLHGWNDIADIESWEVLLLGNGLSVNVWDGFGYDRLLDHAARDHLTDTDKAMFRAHKNFERVLGDLSIAIQMNGIAGVETEPLYERYRSIQHALGQAIREVHPNRHSVPGTTLATIRAVLEQFEWVFTTSYDLLIYWAMGYGGSYRPFKDHFRYAGRCQFDPARCDVYAQEIPVYYLHGALHLVVGSSGDAWKLRFTSLQSILDQFGQPIAGDPQARPLLVTEGSADEKRRTIESNDYLVHALDRLEREAYPTVVFGSRLGNEDEHLVEALSENPRPIAVSMLPHGSKKTRAREQIDLWGRLEAEELYFFDATTHPLGSANLTAQS
jgi:hypothetical protein